ncbi:lipoprotein [Spiroplasma endosymbiont of Glossina fuscipes fuscipes]
MKKLLSLLGAVSLIATGASNDIACYGEKPKEITSLYGMFYNA